MISKLTILGPTLLADLLEAFDGTEHVWALAAALTSREAIRATEKTGDAVTVDVFPEVSRGIDTLLWKIEAHVALEPRWERSETS